MEVLNPEFAKFVQDLADWHEKQIDNLQLILAHPDADISLGPDLTIEAGSDKAKGIRVGIMLALNYLGKLPFSHIECKDSGDDDQ
ncbi:hypothetical protein ACYZFV_10225 [Serratia ureilytica]|uniref:hypothetical protein n=1 Tax=Serratia marcescens TaxID=615 RepID=UPI0007450822|nr:hypothetical protein [Serratia marcescens]CUZ67959.1 Uncharacterised protein [Serratia marcescens]CVF21487.1 Uncharacterised protein [Serratia marcescens]CVG48808.1 Uncharacterised protein [Serratia marcescens]